MSGEINILFPINTSQKTAIDLATVIALSSSIYDNGNSGVGATLTASSNERLPDIDGVTPLLDYRILVQNEIVAAYNGVYVVTDIGSASTKWILTRAGDFNSINNILPGSSFIVTQGIQNKFLVFCMSTLIPIVVGTTDLNFIDLTSSSSVGGDLSGSLPNPEVFQAHLTDQTQPSAPASGTIIVRAFNQQGFDVVHLYDAQGNAVEITRDNFFIVRNTSGATLNKGVAVYQTGTTGAVPTIALAKADSLNTLPCIGLLYDTVPNNGYGRALLLGHLENIDMSAFTEGAHLYVSETTAGDLTDIAPTYPNFIQEIGSVINNGVGNGVIQCVIRQVLNQTAIPSGTAGGDLNGTYPNPTVIKVNGNTPGVSAVAHNFVTSIDTSARGTLAQPSFSDLSGTISTAQQGGTAGGDLGGTLPNPSVEKIHGVSYNGDPLVQYLNLDGRAGGQTAYGGLNAGDSLNLSSSINATKGKINISDDGSIYEDDVNKKLNIGSPRTTTARLNVETNDINTVGVSIRAHSAPGTSAAPNTVAGLVQWIAASSLDGTLSDGANITSITDQSSNGYVWNAASTPPVLKKNIINGQSVMRFTGSGSNWLTTTFTAGNIYSTTGMTVFMIINETTAGGVQEIIFSDSNSNALYGNFSANIYMDWPSTDRLFGPTPTGFAGNFHVLGFTKDASRNQQILVDNSLVTSSTGAHDPIITGTCTGMIGNYFPSTVFNFIGDIAEVVIYKGKLSLTDYRNVYNYLALKYGLPTITNGSQTADLVNLLDDLANVILNVNAGGALGSSGLQYKHATKTSAYIMTVNDDIIFADGGAGAFSITLPSANAVTSFSQKIFIKKIDSTANAITVARAGGDTIEGLTSLSLASQYKSYTLVSDGLSKWYIVCST